MLNLRALFHRFRFSSAALSETGLRRSDNQDAVYSNDALGLYAVADGMGGGAEGARASGLVKNNLSVWASVQEVEFMERVQNLVRAIEDANDSIFVHATAHGYEQMGSTVATIQFDTLRPTRAAVVWVGDSRVYRIRRGCLSPLTRDHRFGFTNALTRAVGVAEYVRCACTEVEVRQGDRFLVCTDGVHGVLADAHLARLVSRGSLKQATQAIREEILEKGAPDNFSFVLVQVG